MTTITLQSLNSAYPATWLEEDATFRIAGNDEGTDYSVDTNTLIVTATGLSQEFESEQDLLEQLASWYEMDTEDNE